MLGLIKLIIYIFYMDALLGGKEGLSLTAFATLGVSFLFYSVIHELFFKKAVSKDFNGMLTEIYIILCVLVFESLIVILGVFPSFYVKTASLQPFQYIFIACSSIQLLSSLILLGYIKRKNKNNE